MSEETTPKNKWDKLWLIDIKCQETWRDLAWYHIIGVIVNEREEDLRVNILFVGDSSSGKTEGIYKVNEVLQSEELKIISKEISEITDATIVGQINYNKKRYNDMHGLSPEKLTIKLNDKEYNWKDPITPGMLSYANSLSFSEAEQILDPKHYNERILPILRQAMDRNRRIIKGVGSNLIEYKTNTSFLFVTFPLKNVLNNLLETGFLQRCFFYFKKISEEDDIEISDYLIKKKFSKESSSIKDGELKKSLISELVTDLTKMKVYYEKCPSKNKDEFSKYVQQKRDELRNDITKIKQEITRNFLLSSFRRGIGKVYTISVLNAVTRFSESIEKEDIDIAFDLYKRCLYSTLEFFNQLDKESKLTCVIIQTIKDSKGQKNKTVLVEDVYKSVKEVLSVGKNTVWNTFAKLEKQGLIEKDEKGLRCKPL